MVLGRYFDAAHIQRIAAITALKPELIALDEKATAINQDYLRQLRASAAVVEPVDDRIVSGYGLLAGVDGQPMFLLRVDFSRSIVSQGEKSLRYFFGAVLAIGVAMGVLSLLLMEHLLFTRIGRITNAVNLIGARADVSQRVPIEGQDEVSRLAEAINFLLVQLEQDQVMSRNKPTITPHDL